MACVCQQDWGSTPVAISNALDIGDKYDVQVSLTESRRASNGPI